MVTKKYQSRSYLNHLVLGEHAALLRTERPTNLEKKMLGRITFY